VKPGRDKGGLRLPWQCGSLVKRTLQGVDAVDDANGGIACFDGGNALLDAVLSVVDVTDNACMGHELVVDLANLQVVVCADDLTGRIEPAEFVQALGIGLAILIREQPGGRGGAGAGSPSGAALVRAARRFGLRAGTETGSSVSCATAPAPPLPWSVWRQPALTESSTTSRSPARMGART